jgi:hypothetical protein
MAFNRADLCLISTFVSAGYAFNVWGYATDADDDTELLVNYFAAAGSTTGDGSLNEGDLIHVWANMDGAGAANYSLMIVTDAAAGDAAAIEGAETTTGGTNEVGLAAFT